tara:strand:+ start:947 stop:1129 length:183 start_codon:yes stop_codon:yes gene_type:complete
MRGVTPPFFMPLKRLKFGEKMPDDFWNYKVNPILGYEYEGQTRNTHKEYKKYGLKTNDIR